MPDDPVPDPAPRRTRTKSGGSAIEDHFLQIEAAVGALEDGELPLEEALRRYEAGLKAVRQARSLLDQYVARLEELRTDDAKGGA